jgi:hypothetical protein
MSPINMEDLDEINLELNKIIAISDLLSQCNSINADGETISTIGNIIMNIALKIKNGLNESKV